MRFGLDVAQHQQAWGGILERARFAEDAGFDGCWVFDHFKALYGDPRGPCLEGWSLLAGLAAGTSRIRLGALVTGVTYRHPSILAAQAVTVDHISGGRLELGIGAAWFEREHVELGIDFPGVRERGERLDEAVQVIRAVMTGEPASFQGNHYRLRNAVYRPRPIQQPTPPIWVGAGGERTMLPIVARRADVWHGFGPAAEMRRKSLIIDRHAEAAGRDPSEIGRSSSLSISEPWHAVHRRAEELAGSGFNYLIVSWPSEGRPRLEEFISDVMPDLGGL